MKVSHDFLLKNRLIVMSLARDLLVTELDERVRTVDSYIEQFDVSRGTVQKAMQFLVEQECVTTDFHGHLGSFLKEKNDKKLWEYSGYGTLSGSMALPLNRLQAGLATGVSDSMKAESISFNCVFVQGSRTRITGLRNGKYDFVVASKLTEQLVLEEFQDVQKVMDLTDCSYCGRYLLLFSDPSKSRVEDGMSVAVDPTSIDQQYITGLICEGKRNIRFDESTYLETIDNVVNGNSDVTVSRLDAVMSLSEDYWRARVQELTLDKHSPDEIDLFGSAVILAATDNYGIASLLRKVILPHVVAHSQKQVAARVRRPGYY